MSEEQKEKWYNSFTREQLIERCEYLQRSCERKEEQITYLDDENFDLETKIERLNNIINTILDFDFFKEECPLNFGYTEKCDEEKAQDVFYEDDYCEENCNDDYKKCWLKYFKKLQELKGSDKE